MNRMGVQTLLVDVPCGYLFSVIQDVDFVDEVWVPQVHTWLHD